MASRINIILSVVFLSNFVINVPASTVDFNDACNKIWSQDKNRVFLGRHYRVSLQGRIYDASSDIDRASSPLFSYVDENVFNKPTFKSFIALLNNYNRFVGNTEDMTEAEKQESWTFLRAISSTGPIKELHKYLVKKGLASTSMNSFIQEMYKIWFYRYQRLEYRDSSGFEHVFLGEISRGKVSGFHNWIQLYQLERKNELDYRGFFRYYNVEPSRMKLQIFWGRYKKLVTSLFLGTSPEFDMALYTLCFLVNPGKSCSCRINGEDIPVTTHGYYGGKFVGSAYLRL